MKKQTKNRIITIVILIAFLGSSLTYAVISAFPTQNQVQVNWMARVAIVIFNEQYPIPAEIGVTNQSKAKIFTINPDGVIYKTGESDVTLGEFFEIWGESFNNTCILDYCNNANNSMRMYVNNKENSEYRNYVIKNKDFILIDYR